MKAKLVNIVTEYDRKQSGKRGYNPYALPQYFAAIDRVLDSGLPIELALKEGFCGSLLRHIARKLGVKYEYE